MARLLRLPPLWLLAALALVPCCTAAARSALPETRGSELPPAGRVATHAKTVELSLVANTTRLEGKPFWLAARLRPPAGAHLYWSNPGESGLATTAEFAGDANHQVSETRYPGPISFESERGALSYGYEGEAALLALVTPTAVADSAEFVVRADWLSCDAVCVRESGEARLELFRDRPTEAIALDAFIERLPVTGAQVDALWNSPSSFTLSAPLGTQLLEFFPTAAFGPEERAPRSTPLGDGQLSVELSAPPSAPLIRGVLRAEESGRVRFLELEVAATTHSAAPVR